MIENVFVLVLMSTGAAKSDVRHERIRTSAMRLTFGRLTPSNHKSIALLQLWLL